MESPVLRGFTLLLILQLGGEALSRWLSLPIPGPVIGFALAALSLVAVASIRLPLKSAADAILPHLSLLFVPAGVGVVLFLKELAEDGAAIAVAIVLSTWVGLAVTAWVGERLLPREHAKSEPTSQPDNDGDERRS
jgi:holin-like protein